MTCVSLIGLVLWASGAPEATPVSRCASARYGRRAMCNLYQMTKAHDEVARLFGTESASVGNAASEVFPGYPGLVVAAGALRSMAWGFPFKPRDAKPESKPRPVNNARADKLDAFLWRYSFLERRCLIPVTRFAEAEGPKGGRTRTWFSLPDVEVFAVAGIWRDTPEWGPSYAMVMTEACVHVAGVHDRMPVILRPEEWSIWTAGAPEEVRSLCRPYSGLMAVERTQVRWSGAR